MSRNRKSALFILAMITLGLTACTGNRDYVVKSAGLEVRLSSEGEMMGVELPEKGIYKEMAGAFGAAHSQVQEVEVNRLSGGGVELRKILLDTIQNREMELVETFVPAGKSIRWTAFYSSDGDPWSTALTTRLAYDAGEQTAFWTAWADPRGSQVEARDDNVFIANALVPKEEVGGNWFDPLISMPLEDAIWYYGAPDFSNENPGMVYAPFQGDVICIPVASFMEQEEDLGLSLVLAHDDLILDLHMETTADGEVLFSRLNHRLGEGRTVEFSADLVAHEADWRPVMKWMTERYPGYYDPVNPLAHEVAGTAAYSNRDVDFDVEKMKKMAFKVNWRASFDFPYMGMFLPPLYGDQTWGSFIRAGNRSWKKPWIVSVDMMEEYCRGMRENGFHVLSYFNVTEFGAGIEWPPPPRKMEKEEDLWKDANDFLYTNLADAILFAPDKQVPVRGIGYYSIEPGDPYVTWERALAMDPADPAYQAHLLNQARRHVEELPSSSGICIDRMDWLRFYNHRADDGVSWFGDQAVRSLNTSWHGLMDQLAPIFHDAGKLLYVNNHVKRIDLLNHVDGIFDEFTYAGAPLNTIALMCVRKPCMGWMSNDKQLLPDPDAVIQKYIYLGVYPMAPFPGNDHSMRPSELADSVYLAYGSLFKKMEGKRWVLEPHVIEVEGNEAKANIFKVPSGYTIPVVYAGDQEGVKVILRLPEADAGNWDVSALHPGEEVAVAVTVEERGGHLVLDVPVHRGCAMVSIKSN